MNINRILKFTFFSLLLTTSLVYAAKKGWWERLFPKEKPQVLRQSGPTAPRMEPPLAVKNLQDSFAQVAQAVKPAVVNISAIQISRVEQDPQEFFFGDSHEFFRRFFGEGSQQKRPSREYRTEGTGSGVIIDPEGYILTNNHVIQNASLLTVTLSDGKSFRGKTVGADPRTDLAVIRIKSSNPFSFVPLGDSNNTRMKPLIDFL